MQLSAAAWQAEASARGAPAVLRRSLWWANLAGLVAAVWLAGSILLITISEFFRIDVPRVLTHEWVGFAGVAGFLIASWMSSLALIRQTRVDGRRKSVFAILAFALFTTTVFAMIVSTLDGGAGFNDIRGIRWQMLLSTVTLFSLTAAAATWSWAVYSVARQFRGKNWAMLYLFIASAATLASVLLTFGSAVQTLVWFQSDPFQGRWNAPPQWVVLVSVAGGLLLLGVGIAALIGNVLLYRWSKSRLAVARQSDEAMNVELTPSLSVVPVRGRDVLRPAEMEASGGTDASPQGPASSP